MDERDTAIRDELERILASASFAGSPMLAAFLRYVVEETLAGRADRLKAYTIAVGALARAENFDPNENPLVRVQARRLRQALRRHYETTAATSIVRIDLPLGSYVPLFLEVVVETVPSPFGGDLPPSEVADLVTEIDIEIAALDDGGRAALLAPPKTDRTTTGLRRFTRPALSTAMLLIGVAVGAAAMLWLPTAPSPPPVATPAPVAPPATPAVTAPVDAATPAERRNLDASRVLPLLYVDVEAREPAPVGFDAEIYRNRIESFAQRFDDAIVVTRRSPDFPAPDGQPLYRLSFLLTRDGTSTRAHWRLVHSGDERLLKAGAVTLPPAPADAVPPGSAELPPDLVLVRDMVQRQGIIPLDLSNLDDLSPELHCIAQAWRFHRELTAPTHLAARTCLETLVVDDPRLAPALTLLGALYVGEYRQGFDRRPGDPLARAEDLLGHAVRVAPASSAPYQFFSSLMIIKGDTAAALAAARRAIDLNPADLAAVGSYGSILARLGRYDEALPILRRAAEATSSPKWLEYYLFVALNNLGRAEEADREVALFDGTRSSLFLTAVAIRAHRRGDAAAAAAAFADIARAEPDFTTDPRAFLRRRGFVAPVIDRLMVDLGRAGLPAPRP